MISCAAVFISGSVLGAGALLRKELREQAVGPSKASPAKSEPRVS